MVKQFSLIASACGLALLLLGCQTNDFKPEKFENLNTKYDVIIRRDLRGVPHIKGKTDPDTAFGFAYAQAEDNWQLIEDAIPFYRGENGLYAGLDGAVTDYLVKWLGLWETLNEQYQWDLSPDTRSYVEAFADGLNYYAALHPDLVDETKLPIKPKDIVMGFMLRHLMFYGFDGVIRELNKASRQRPLSERSETEVKTKSGDELEEESISFDGLPIGSNAFAISTRGSEEGATRIAINSHQPLTGPVAWYEAHIKSDTGLDVLGGLFPGGPVINVGFTENLAWGATVNNPDLVDVFVLEINPEDADQYWFDGAWKNFEKKEVDIDLRIWGFLPWSVSREALYSEHGPAIRTDHGTYAVRYAGMGEIRQLEQWYRMNQAQNFDDWREAMSMLSFASFNFVYADKDDNIMFLHNSLTPRRIEGYEWNNYLPGDRSELIWKETLGFSQLPQVINPDAGFVLSANQTPFRVTHPSENPKQADYSPVHGFQLNMTNRANRGLELFESLLPISRQEFFEIKHDKFYSKTTDYVTYLDKIRSANFAEPLLKEAQAVISDWDLATDQENLSAALGTCVLLAAERDDDREQHSDEQVESLLNKCAVRLMEARGSLNPRWGDVNRHVRGELNLGVGGGPDILRAVYGSGLEEDGFLTNRAGDGLYYIVSWDRNGNLEARGLHQYGSATLDETSPHYSDQAQDYVDEKMHDPWFEEEKILSNLKIAYRPGEEAL